MTAWKVTTYGFYWIDDYTDSGHEVRYVEREYYFADHDTAVEYSTELIDGENEVEVTEIEVE